MKNNRILKKQNRRFLVYNLIAFFIIFILLGLAAVLSVEGYFYRDADKELRFYREQLVSQQEPPDRPEPEAGDPPDRPEPDFKKNPRINYLLYNENKEVLLDLSNIPNLSFDSLPAPKAGERIYNVGLEGFNFRVLEFSFTGGGIFYYAQILLNIDGEIALRNNIVSIYLICLSAIIVLSVAASYLMSAFTMRPIKKSMEEQTRFASDASHELRTPLTVLHGRLEQLLGFPDEKIIDKSDEISYCLSEVMRLTKLSGDLLTLAKSDSDKFVPDISETDISAIINETLSPYADMGACDNKEIISACESIKISADAGKIRQALIILFDNALKYTQPGDSITVDARKTKNKCVISVADTGIGISEKGMQKVFERFYRDDNSRTITEGSGLGLSIVKQIIEEHNGTISVSQNTPKGTKFTILLPL